MITDIRRSSRTCVRSAVPKPAGPLNGFLASSSSPQRPIQESKKAENAQKVVSAVKPSNISKSVLRCYKKVRRAVIIINSLVASRKLAFLDGARSCRTVVGFFEKQYSARCQMHAVNNALERNHLTFEDIERVRIKRVKAFKLKNSGEKVPDLGGKHGMWDRGVFMDAARASKISVVKMRLGVDGKKCADLLFRLNEKMKDYKDGLKLVLYLQYDTKADPRYIQEVKHAVAVRMLPRLKDITDPFGASCRKFADYPIDQYRVIDSDSRKEWPLSMYPLMSSVTTIYSVRLNAHK